MLKDKRLFTMILSSLFLCGVLISTPVFAQDNSAVTQRISGSDRFETSTAISKAGWTNATTIIIVSGIDYPDALAASALSKSRNAPIILTDKGALKSTTLVEIQSLKATKALLIGGTGVIGANVENQLKALKIGITRIGGSDRYDTSKKVAEMIGVTKGIIMAANLDFPDPLSIAPIAAVKGMPILITPKVSLNSNIATFIKGKTIPISYLVGGTGVLGSTIASSVPNSKRLSGNDRYATNLSINKEFEGVLDFNTIYLASGNNFPDALSGSALAAKNNAPIFLTDKDSISNETVNYIKSKNVKKIVILGGTGSVSKNVEDVISNAITITPTIVKVASVSLSKDTDTLTVGDSDTLLATVAPTNAANKTVNWTSSNPERATVDTTGKVTGVSLGTAEITATTVDGGFISTCIITVAIPAVIKSESVTLNKTYDSLTIGNADMLSANVAPDNAANKEVVWTTSDNNIAAVDNTGNVTSVSLGSAVITATTVDGSYTATCSVTVTPIVKATGVTLTPTTDEIGVGGAYNLIALVAPDNATNKVINWTTSNNSVATVDNTGKVTGVTEGSAAIMATTADGSYTAAWSVTVSTSIPVTIPTLPINPGSLTVAIDIGHNSIYDTGAMGIKSEDVLNKEVGTRVMTLLSNLGYNVVDCAPVNATSLTDSLKQRSDKANGAKADYYVAIHFNAFSNGDANGTMIYSSSTKINGKAANILSNMQALGYYNRGLLDNSRGLYVLSHTNMPAILVECAFLTSVSDMDRYNPDDIASAIVNGLISGN